MVEDKNSSNFFILRHFWKFLLGFLGGSVVFSLFIIQALNELHRVFGIRMWHAYLLFVFLYFFLFSTAILIGLKIKRLNSINYAFRISPRLVLGGESLRSVVSGAIIVAIFSTFLSTKSWISIILPIVATTFITYTLVRTIRYRNKLKLKSSWRELRTTDYEFYITIVLSLIITVLFLVNEWRKNQSIFLNEHVFVRDAASQLEDYYKINDIKKEFIQDLLSQVKSEIEFYQGKISLDSNMRQAEEIFFGKPLFYGEDSLKTFQFTTKMKKDSLHPLKRFVIENMQKIDTAFINLSRQSNANQLDSLYLNKLVRTQKLLYHLNQTLTASQKVNYLRVQSNWYEIIVKLQFKGLLWLFCLFVLALSTVYIISLKVESLPEEEMKPLIKTFVKPPVSQSFSKLQFTYYQTQLNVLAMASKKESKRKTDLQTTAKVLSSFIIGLGIFILPFLRHLEKSDIDLEKPFVNYDLGNLTGIPLLKSGKPDTSLNLNSSPSKVTNEYGDTIGDNEITIGEPERDWKDRFDSLDINVNRIQSIINNYLEYDVDDKRDLEKIRKIN